MDLKQFEADAAAGIPSVPSSFSVGFPTNGNPGSGTAASKPGAYWFYQVLEEFRYLIQDVAGLTPDHETLTQLADALIAMGLRQADESQTGVSERATDAEAQGFTDDARHLTPLKLNNAFKGGNQSFGTGNSSGYQKLPGGLILQWMEVDITTSTQVFNLPITFPNNAFVGMVSDIGNATHVVSISAITTSQVTTVSASNGGGASAAGTAHILALGD
jgi:hypothetical protein